MAACVLAAAVLPSSAQSLPPADALATIPKPTKFSAVASRAGRSFLTERLPIPSAQAQRIQAEVVRLEDLTTHDVVLSLQVRIIDRRDTGIVREIAVVSEEEMADLKGAVDQMIARRVELAEKSRAATVEYHTLSGAIFGYAVHRRTLADEEVPATAYVEMPANPYISQSGISLRLSAEVLQKIVADAAKMMDDLRTPKEGK